MTQSSQYKSSYLPKARGAFDFETWLWVNPRACGFMWGPPWLRKREIFIDSESKNPAVVAKQALWHMARMPDGVREWWGHNAGKFDSLFILQAAADLGWKCRCHIAGGRVITLKIEGPNGEFKIHDSMAVVPGALKKIAESFELKSRKLLGDDDYSKDVREWAIERLTEGCYADCECVLELLEKVETLFQQEGGQLKPTFSGAALSVVGAHTQLLDMRKLQGINTICRNSYMGGRVEVYRHTPQYELKEWDINSSYPYSMSQPLPWLYSGQSFKLQAAADFESDTRAGVIDATVSVPDTYLPVLPWRHPKHGGIYFPVGTWRAHFDSRELRYAVANGARIESLHSMQVFSVEQPFTAFIDAFYRLKANSTGAKREFYKLVLNGCYGKFAMKPEREEVHIYGTQDEAIESAFLPKHKNRFRFLSASDMRFVAIASEVWSKQTHYALASAITANSRVALHGYLSAAEKIAYTDTDSIHASRRSEMARFESTDCGALKVELDNYSGVFAAPKIYGLTENKLDGKKHFASKGFPVSEETFNRILKGEVIESQRMHLALRQLKADNQVRRSLFGRSWKGLSTKRRPLYDADGDTTPWNVKQLLSDEHLLAVSPLAKWLSKD